MARFRLRRGNLAVLAFLVPLWGICFAHQLVHTLRGELGFPGIVASGAEDETAHPTISWIGRSFLVASADLQVGDRVHRIGSHDTIGTGPARFRFLLYSEADRGLGVPVIVERDGETFATTLPLTPENSPWSVLLMALTWMACGVTVMLRAPTSTSANAFAHAMIAYSFHPLLAFWTVDPEWVNQTRVAALFVSGIFTAPLVIKGAALFPEEAGFTNLRSIRWRWLFLLMIPAYSCIYFGVPLPTEVGRVGLMVIATAVMVSALSLFTRNYLRSDPVGRRRIKWVVLGAYVAFFPTMAMYVLIFVEPTFTWLESPAVSASLLFPIITVIAIVRFNLFDVDRLLSATAAYTIAGIALLTGLLVVVPRAAVALGSFVGTGSGTSQLALSVVAAAISVPFGRRLRPQIERLFFAERHRLEQGGRALIDRLSRCEDPRALMQLAGEQLTEMLRPEVCVIYSRSGPTFGPIFVRGRGGPPAFEAEGPLVGAIERSTGPLAMERFTPRGAGPALGPFDRAVLETLEAAVVIPIHLRTAGLVGLVCLGPKRSGDVYTSTDLTLLAAFAQQVSAELLRFEQEDLVQEANAMRDSLSAYVPGAVQEQLASGADPTAGEREVTVLFVDIRGYAAFSEARAPDEIFSTVNAYTETVSSIVQEQGGSVVEFNGDGMMAVFGAPRSLPEKEKAAVTAGLEITERVRSIGPGEGGEISVGVGVATGPAYVGSVRSVDRLIWTALGNTTNLAARLQGLTRDLEAHMVIDTATHRASGDAGAGFELRDEMQIRGRSQREDLYLLPL